MKKLLLCFLVSASLLACNNQEAKTETKPATPETKGTVTSTGPDVDLIKKCITAFANADWATYASCYADTAKAFHNVWPSATDTSVGVRIPQLIEGHKKQREIADGNITLGETIYEVVTMPDGNKYGHLWVKMSWKLKNGAIGKTVLFNSYGINKDGKITYEWPIFDTKDVVRVAQ